MQIADQIRAFSLTAAMLGNRASDPFCGACNSFNNTLGQAKDLIVKFESQHNDEIGTLPEDFSFILMEAKNLITAIEPSSNPVGQKKMGNCKLPEGVCFTKMSLAMSNG